MASIAFELETKYYRGKRYSRDKNINFSKVTALNCSPQRNSDNRQRAKERSKNPNEKKISEHLLSFKKTVISKFSDPQSFFLRLTLTYNASKKIKPLDCLKTVKSSKS